MSEHIGKSDARLALRRESTELRECGSYLIFREYLDVDVVRLHGMRSCRMHVLCPSCAVRRGCKFLGAYEAKFRQIRVERPSLVLQMITLTVRDGAVLEERFDHLRRCHRRWWKQSHLGRGSESEKIVGAVFSHEVKRGKGSGLWHPHIHMLALVEPDNRVSQSALVAEWKNITGDSFVLDVHDVYGEAVEAFGEVFKYAVKFDELPLEDNLDAYRVLRGKRLVDSTGIFRGVRIPDSMVDDLLDDESLRYVDVLWRHSHGSGYRRVGTAFVSGLQRRAA